MAGTNSRPSFSSKGFGRPFGHGSSKRARDTRGTYFRTLRPVSHQETHAEGPSFSDSVLGLLLRPAVAEEKSAAETRAEAHKAAKRRRVGDAGDALEEVDAGAPTKDVIHWALRGRVRGNWLMVIGASGFGERYCVSAPLLLILRARSFQSPASASGTYLPEPLALAPIKKALVFDECTLGMLAQIFGGGMGSGGWWGRVLEFATASKISPALPKNRTYPLGSFSDPAPILSTTTSTRKLRLQEGTGKNIEDDTIDAEQEQPDSRILAHEWTRSVRADAPELAARSPDVCAACFSRMLREAAQTCCASYDGIEGHVMRQASRRGTCAAALAPYPGGGAKARRDTENDTETRRSGSHCATSYKLASGALAIPAAGGARARRDTENDTETERSGSRCATSYRLAIGTRSRRDGARHSADMSRLLILRGFHVDREKPATQSHMGAGAADTAAAAGRGKGGRPCRDDEETTEQPRTAVRQVMGNETTQEQFGLCSPPLGGGDPATKDTGAEAMHLVRTGSQGDSLAFARHQDGKSLLTVTATEGQRGGAVLQVGRGQPGLVVNKQGKGINSGDLRAQLPHGHPLKFCAPPLHFYNPRGDFEDRDSGADSRA
eukprot:g366.t1